jgi:hypothetical protein
VLLIPKASATKELVKLDRIESCTMLGSLEGSLCSLIRSDFSNGSLEFANNSLSVIVSESSAGGGGTGGGGVIGGRSLEGVMGEDLGGI